MDKLLKAVIVCAAVVSLAATAFAGGEVPAKKVYAPVPTVEQAKPSFLYKALWYVPNRALDLVDIPSANLGYGFGWGIEAHVTNDVKAGYAGFEVANGAGYDTRQFYTTESGGKVKMSGVKLGELYDNNGDTVAVCMNDNSRVGLSAQAGIAGGAEVSLFQAWDFVAGFAGADPAKDDK